MRVRAGIVGMVVLILFVAACGGSSRLSKSQFDAKANAICKRYTQKINAVPTPKSISDVPAYVDDVKPFIERGVDALAVLKPPKDLQSTYDEWLSTQREALTQADQLRKAAEKSDLAGVNRTIKALDDRNKRGNALASALGAEVCAKG